jgi:putative RNA 2'-phosphotransferase
MPRLPRQLEDLARMLTYILCHRPDEFGLVLDSQGFIPLKTLLQALAAERGFGFVRRRHLEELAALLQPPPFELSGEQIRGLSPGPAQLRRTPEEMPPPLLYLAIAPKAQAAVWEQGLKPPPGRELVLAATPERARRLGQRRAPQPLLITVQAQAATRAGLLFQGYGEDLYLAAGAIPREFLQMPAPPKEPEKARPAPARPPAPPGSLILDLPQMFQELPKTRGKVKGEVAWKKDARGLRKKGRGREK